ncbi:MAG: hypothetical protein ACR2LE_01540 [Nocardioidaceae bacterium]
MTSREALAQDEDRPLRRVREEVRDGVAVCCTSVAASLVVALALTFLSKLAG